MSTNKQKKRKMSPAVSKALGIVVFILIVGGVVAALLFSGAVNFGVNNGPESDPEVAKSVCEKYGGILRTGEDSEEYKTVVSCTNATDSSESEDIDEIFNSLDPDRINEIFLFQIYYLGSKNLDSRWKKARSSLSDSPYYNVLENSEDFIKVYAAASNDYGVQYNFATFYKDMMGVIMAYDAHFAEDLLVELGFPNHGYAEAYELTSENTEEE